MTLFDTCALECAQVIPEFVDLVALALEPCDEVWDERRGVINGHHSARVRVNELGMNLLDLLGD